LEATLTEAQAALAESGLRTGRRAAMVEGRQSDIAEPLLEVLG